MKPTKLTEKKTITPQNRNSFYPRVINETSITFLDQENTLLGEKTRSCYVCFLLGYSPASEFCVPTFWNTLSHLHRQVFTQPPAYEDGTECSETSAHKIQTLGNNPEESIHHLEHSKSLKSRRLC